MANKGWPSPMGLFTIPALPKPEYRALRRLCELLTAETGQACTQLEAICVGIRLAAERVRQNDMARLVEELQEFRTTAPKETPPLL